MQNVIVILNNSTSPALGLNAWIEWILVNVLHVFSLFLKENYFIVVQLQLSAFSPHPSTPPQPNPLPSPASILPLGFVYVSK